MNASRDPREALVTPLPVNPRLREGVANIPSEQLERIVRRASELQRQQGVDEPGALTEDEVMRIGAEVGLESKYLRRAIAEAHAESLLPPSTMDLPLLDSLCGSACVRVKRVVAGSGETLQRRIEAQLSERESLKVLRRRNGMSAWEPADGWIAHLQRGLDFSGHGYHLADARSVELTLAPLERDYSMVSLTADLGNQRNGHLISWAGGLGGSALALVFVGAKKFGLGLAMTSVLGLAAAAIAIVGIAIGTRWSLSNLRRRTLLKLESVLDRVDPEGG